MNQNLVVTSGEAFVDVDAVACAIAYAELLQLEDKKAEVVFPGTLNASITPSLVSLGLPYLTRPSQSQSKYVVVDVSEPEFFAQFVALDDVVEVYDHHPGFESYWAEKIGKNAHIESIGACATLIWEEFKKRGKGSFISEKSSHLLMTAIVSNTLNFGAVITHERDRRSYTELSQKIKMVDDWIEKYFLEQEREVIRNPVNAITSDTKILTFSQLESPVVVGQSEIWNGKKFIETYQNDISLALDAFRCEQSIMNVLSLSEGKSRFYSRNQTVKDLFSQRLGVKFDGDFGIASRLWLRKEILKQLGR